MAASPVDDVGDLCEDPTTTQDWTPTKTARHKRGVHGATIVEDAKVLLQDFKVSFRVARQNDGVDTFNLSTLHKELLGKLFNHVPDLVINSTSELPTKSNKPMTTIDQFPKSNRDHVNFFHRRIVPSKIGHFTTIELRHVVLTTTPISKIKSEILPWLQEKKVYISGDDVSANEMVSLGFLHGAHHSMVNKFDLADKLNELINSVPLLDEYRQKYSKLSPSDEIPQVICLKRHIPWGVDSERVTSYAVSVCCIKSVSRFLKEVVSSIDPDSMPYEFVPSGHATMTDAKDYREMLIYYNNFQNAIQGLPIIGMSRSTMETVFQSPKGAMSVIDFLASHPGVDSIEATKHTEEKGRWIMIVWKEHFESVKSFAHEFCE